MSEEYDEFGMIIEGGMGSDGFEEYEDYGFGFSGGLGQNSAALSLDGFGSRFVPVLDKSSKRGGFFLIFESYESFMEFVNRIIKKQKTPIINVTEEKNLTFNNMPGNEAGMDMMGKDKMKGKHEASAAQGGGGCPEGYECV